jgi:fucose permease
MEENISNTTAFSNASTDMTENHKVDTTRITILYPLVGLSIVFMSMGYLMLAMKNYNQISSAGSQVKSDKNDSDLNQQTLNRNHWFLLVIMIGFFFFYAGSEISFGIYLTAFCVKSRLSLPKQIGAEMTATFWGCFAAMRFLAIFAAIYLKPIYLMSLSCLVSCLSGILLAIYGDQSVTILWVGSAMLGFGMASIYATGLLWLESHMKITNRIGT